MKSLSHAQARDLIHQAADGMLSAEEQRTLEHHLQGCAQCRAFAKELASLEGSLTRVLSERWGEPKFPQGNEKDLVKQVQKAFPPGSTGGGKPPKLWFWLLLVALFFILFFATGGMGALTLQTSLEPTITATSTWTMTPSPTNTPTSTALLPTLYAFPNRNANCRLGPSATYFEIDDTLVAEMSYMPLSQGPDGEWLLFDGPKTQNRCWVFIDNLELFCDEFPVEITDLTPCSLPIVQYPPFPTFTPTSTFTPEPTDVFVPQCADGIDNDGDRRIDFPSDTGCTSASDNSEN